MDKFCFRPKFKRSQKSSAAILQDTFFFIKTTLLIQNRRISSQVKKYVELDGLKVSISVADTKKEDEKAKYKLILSKSQIFVKLVVDQESIEQWRDHLRKHCIMMNFDDSYTILESLGKGSSGKVLLAKNNHEWKTFCNQSL